MPPNIMYRRKSRFSSFKTHRINALVLTHSLWLLGQSSGTNHEQYFAFHYYTRLARCVCDE